MEPRGSQNSLGDNFRKTKFVVEIKVFLHFLIFFFQKLEIHIQNGRCIRQMVEHSTSQSTNFDLN
jgi:hypothetical protein